MLDFRAAWAVAETAAGEQVISAVLPPDALISDMHRTATTTLSADRHTRVNRLEVPDPLLQSSRIRRKSAVQRSLSATSIVELTASGTFQSLRPLILFR
jgi:hypothetical protein